MKTQLFRTIKGQSSAEVAIGAFLVIVMAAIGVDMTILTIGFCALDSATRDAARAAGGQSDSSTAYKAAQAQMATHVTDGTFIQQPALISNTAPYFVYQDFGGAAPPNPQQSPYVTVTCRTKMRLPMYIPFFGVNISTDADAQGCFTLSRAYTFPIVKEKFYG